MRRPQLPSALRIAAARVHGTAARVRDWPLEQAVAELRAVSTNPRVLGDALGVFLHRVETEDGSNQPSVDALRAAGADEDWAAGVLAWLRWRDGQRAASEGRPVL